MDGFDEFIDEAKEAGISNIVSFMKIIDNIAFEYDIHIVVLSRTIAVNDYLNAPTIEEKSFKLMPITEEQQDRWLKKHNEFDDYQGTLRSIRDNKEMSDLLGIPLLFRMIVYSRFDKVSSNVIELYDRLTDHLLEKRNICEIDDKEQVVSGLRELAYDIYCNDTDTVTVPEVKWDTRWVFAFYISQIRKRVIGFFHRSFYQYFLARFILFRILDVKTDKQAEDLIGLFAEREIDGTVRQYLSLLMNEKNKQEIHNKLKLVIEALVRTEAYLNLKPRYQDGNAEKTKLGRTINVYRNTMHLCAAFSYVIEKPFGDGIDVFLRTYPSDFIIICSAENKRADLIGANLRGADLSEADLRGADMSGAKLIRADISGANLREADLRDAQIYGADLIRANLSHVNLSRADLRDADLFRADLIRANLSEADLSEANLLRADLSGANLNEADLSGAKLIRANLNGADLRGADLRGADLRAQCFNNTIIDIDKKKLIDSAIEGYETIAWVNKSAAD